MDFVKDSVFRNKFDFESDLINVKEYFDEFSAVVPSFEPCRNEKCKAVNPCGLGDCKLNEFCRNYLGLTQEELKELQNRTSIDLLKCENEENYYKVIDSGSDDVNQTKVKELNSPLVSVNKRLEMIEVTKSNFPRTYYKYCSHEWTLSKEKFTPNLEFDALKFPTIVACVRVYNPFNSCRESLYTVKLLHEIHILGDQTLSQLKDKIVCTLDYIEDRDLSNEWFLKDVGVSITTKDEYVSSFIFIEDTFYNDTRSSKHKDLSKVLREWAAEKKLGNFKTAIMENTKISDLNLRIGRPYVYQHQGNCEHIIMFSDIRFLDSGDPLRYRCFPRIYCTGKTYGKHCMMCSQFYARWLVVGNERLTHERTFLCNKCFVSYNYVDGRKIGNFQAFKYVDPVALL